MHRSREAGRFQMDNHSSRPGDCGRYPTEIMRIFALLVTLAALGCSSEPSRNIPDPLGVPMPAEATAALRTGIDFELLSLDPSYLDRDQRPTDFHNWDVLGSTAVSQFDRSQLVDALIASVPESVGAIAACFNPRHGIRVTHDGKQFDFVICFECLQIYWYTDDEKNPKILTSGSPLKLFNDVLTDASIPVADPA